MEKAYEKIEFTHSFLWCELLFYTKYTSGTVLFTPVFLANVDKVGVKRENLPFDTITTHLDCVPEKDAAYM